MENNLSTLGTTIRAQFDNPIGGAAMVQLTPLDRFLRRYVLYAPDGWFQTHVTVTRRQGQSIWLDGVLVDDEAFSPVGPNHDVAQVNITAGSHVLTGVEPFGAMVTGVGLADAYSYLAGAGQPVATIDPEG